MRRGGNQADVAVLLAQALVILADGHEAGVLALRAGVGLQRDGVEAGRRAEHALQLVEELAVALHLVERREGMDLRAFRPGDRLPLSRRVQLHGSGAERAPRAVAGT